MASVMAAMLDELMGKDRDLLPDEKPKEITWDNPKVRTYEKWSGQQNSLLWVLHVPPIFGRFARTSFVAFVHTSCSPILSPIWVSFARFFLCCFSTGWMLTLLLLQVCATRFMMRNCVTSKSEGIVNGNSCFSMIVSCSCFFFFSFFFLSFNIVYISLSSVNIFF